MGNFRLDQTDPETDMTEVDKVYIDEYNATWRMASISLQHQIKTVLLGLHAARNMSVEDLSQGPSLTLCQQIKAIKYSVETKKLLGFVREIRSLTVLTFNRGELGEETATTTKKKEVITTKLFSNIISKGE